MAHHRKLPYKRKNLLRKPSYKKIKNLTDISYMRRDIAHFVPNFVTMATGIGREKMQLAAFDGPFPKTPL